MNKHLIIISLFFVVSCQPINHQKIKQTTNVKYAEHFDFFYSDEETKIVVYNPWQGAQNKKFEYILTSDTNIKNSKKINVPIKKAICFSTTHLGFIEAIDERNSIVGLSGTQFVYDSIIIERIKQKELFEIGFDNNVDIELILSLKPQVVFVYDISGTMKEKFDFIEKAGIPVVYVAEYLENEPLGRAEWIKFFAFFYNKNDNANKIFENVENQYLEIKNQNSKKNKPNIIVNIPFQGLWYMPGGRSFMAKLIEDAGGNYIWKKNNQTESFIVSIEEVFKYNKQIDILINTSLYNSIDQIIESESRFRLLNCIQQKKVFNNTKRINSNNANDFWESGVVYPNIILKDLSICFLEDTILEKNLIYYKKLN